MSRALVDRYTSDIDLPLASDAVQGATRVERRMIRLAQRQIEMQRAAAIELSRSNLNSATIIASALDEQTEYLTDAIAGLSEDLSDGLDEATKTLEQGIELVGDRVCTSLDEIRWQLAQQAHTLDQILATLKSSRNNEAQQLVRQGVRHFVNGQYERAEERFAQALTFDTTDYQVLMNVAFIELHKGNAQGAHDRFMDALNLPDHLDPLSRLRTMWALARLHHAQREHDRSLEIARQALAFDQKPSAEAFFTSGVYAALAHDKDYSLRMVETAIQRAPVLFARAAIEPGLANLRGDVLQLLSKLASDAQASAESALQKAASVCAGARKQEFYEHYASLLSSVEGNIDDAQNGLRDHPSFVRILELRNLGDALAEAATKIAQLDFLYVELNSAEARLKASERAHLERSQEIGPVRQELPIRRLDRRAYVLLYGIAGLAGGILGALTARSAGMVLLAFVMAFTWPVSFVLSGLEVLFDGDGLHAPIAAPFAKGVVAGIVTSFVVWYVVYYLPAERLEHARHSNESKRKQLAASEADVKDRLGTIRMIKNRIHDRRAEIAALSVMS